LTPTGNEHNTQVARDYWVKTAYQQLCKLLYLALSCLVYVVDVDVTAEAGTNTAHCLHLGADLSSLQLIVVRIFLYECI